MSAPVASVYAKATPDKSCRTQGKRDLIRSFMLKTDHPAVPAIAFLSSIVLT